jgi:hypothetical protein
VVAVAAAAAEAGSLEVRGSEEAEPVAVMRECEGHGLDKADELWGSLVSFSPVSTGHSETQDG